MNDRNSLRSLRLRPIAKLGRPVFRHAAALPHSLPLRGSLARSPSPTRLHLLPQLLSFTHTLSLSLSVHIFSSLLALYIHLSTPTRKSVKRTLPREKSVNVKEIRTRQGAKFVVPADDFQTRPRQNMHDTKPGEAPANNLTTKIINPCAWGRQVLFGGTSVQAAFVLS